MGRTVWGSNSRGGDIFHTCPDQPCGPPHLLYNGYQIIFGVNCPEHGVNHPPPSSAEFKGRVKLHLYCHTVPSWLVLGWSTFYIFNEWTGPCQKKSFCYGLSPLECRHMLLSFSFRMSPYVTVVLFDTWHVLMLLTVVSCLLLVLVGSSQIATIPYTGDIVSFWTVSKQHQQPITSFVLLCWD
jgi:hypothetical protein